MDESSVEIEKEAKQLKRDLEAWREVVLLLNSVLTWKKDYYVGVIILASSLLFFLLWQLDPSILTVISFLGIIITVVDYLIPKLTLQFCHPESWTSAKERELESICKSLITYKKVVTDVVKSYYSLRESYPKFYYSSFIMTLLFLSWIGNEINNLFLSYLFVTSMLLFPGIQQRAPLDRIYKHLIKLCRYKSVQPRLPCDVKFE